MIQKMMVETAIILSGANADRTRDLLIANQALSQLSYDPVHLLYTSSR